MATLGSPTGVPAGLVHLVLGELSSADTWHGAPQADTFEQLLRSVPSGDVELIPAAIGECLLPLRGDKEVLQLALDLIRSFDLHEASAGLIALLRESPTELAVLTAAALAQHPSVPGLLGELAGMAASSAEDREFGNRVRALVTGELGLGADHTTAMLFAERWPGRVRTDAIAAPVIVLGESAGSPGDVLRFALDIRRAGAQVRRVDERREVPEGWLPQRSGGVLVTEKSRPKWWRTTVGTVNAPLFRSYGSLSASVRRELLERISRTLPGRLSLRLRTAEKLFVGDLPDPLLSADAFFTGALRLPEVRYLTGWSPATIRKRGKEFPDELQPRSAGYGRGSYLDFAQLTALRVEHYVSAKFGRSPSSNLAATIVREARANRSVPLVITTTGEVLFEEDDETLRDATGQTSFQAARLAEIAEQFDATSGTVPALRHPSEHTSVHPAVHLGTPVVAGTRIPATAVRDVVRQGRAAGFLGAELEEWTNRHFPSLETSQVDDAAAVGEAILA